MSSVAYRIQDRLPIQKKIGRTQAHASGGVHGWWTYHGDIIIVVFTEM
jgi:hypothetical protein